MDITDTSTTEETHAMDITDTMQKTPILPPRKYHTNYVCGVCTKDFCSSYKLDRHSVVHTKERPYPCVQCDKKFSTNNQLTRHMRVHSGVKPYVCGTCGKAFARSDVLARHIQMHVGDKTHVCETCSRAFLRSDDLVSHRRTHSGLKPHVCGTCGKACAKADNLVIHILRHHKDPESLEVKEYRARTNKQQRHHYAHDQQYKASRRCRSVLRKWMRKKGGTKTSKTECLVGCTWAQLVVHLNTNERCLTVGQDGVDIDHIRPVSSFNLFDSPVEQRACFNFNNLQLLTADENRNVKHSKHNQVEYDMSPVGIEILSEAEASLGG